MNTLDFLPLCVYLYMEINRELKDAERTWKESPQGLDAH